MRYGYVRSATQDETSIKVQIEALQRYNLDKVIVEKSGHDLNDLLERLQEGDIIHVRTIDRISRRIPECMDKFSIIQKAKAELWVMDTRILI